MMFLMRSLWIPNIFFPFVLVPIMTCKMVSTMMKVLRFDTRDSPLVIINILFFCERVILIHNELINL
jgi:hypothetical protein